MRAINLAGQIIWRNQMQLDHGNLVNLSSNGLTLGRGASLSRRHVLAGTVLTLATALSSPAAAVMTSSCVNRSWLSGASLASPKELAAFERFRGRPAEAVTVFCVRKTWSDIENIGTKSQWLAYVGPNRPQLLVLSFGWLPTEPRGFAPFYEPTKTPYLSRWNALAAALGTGSSDDCEPHWVKAADSMTRAAKNGGYNSLVVRIGWEFTAKDNPWSAYEVQYAPAFRKMWARCATILKNNKNGVQVLTQWDPLRRGQVDASVDNWYPNEEPDTVDIIGVNYYEGAPIYRNQADWDKQFYRTHLGGPWGLGAWLEYAKSKGKKFGIGEWGVHLQSDGVAYIRGMRSALSCYADVIAYENLYEMFTGSVAERKLSTSLGLLAARLEYIKGWSLPALLP